MTLTNLILILMAVLAAGLLVNRFSNQKNGRYFGETRVKGAVSKPAASPLPKKKHVPKRKRS